MATFKDQNGREWLLKLTAPKISAIRKELLFDPVDLNSNVFDKLSSDVVLFVNTLWVMVRDQAIDQGVSEVQFGESLVGDAIERAYVAAKDCICDFFPTSTAAALRAVSRQDDQMRAAMFGLLEETTRQLPATMEAIVQRQKKTIRDQLDKLMSSS